jgi:hypothetical protein
VTTHRPLRALLAVLSLGVVGSILLTTSPAFADGTSGSFCYEDSTTTRSSTHSLPSGVTFSATMTYRILRSCVGAQVGVRVISSAISYSGGFNGLGLFNVWHGMSDTGLSYMKCDAPAGDEIYDGSVFGVGGFPRGYTYGPNVRVYSGTGHNAHQSFSFLDTGVFGFFEGPESSISSAPSWNVWYIPLRNQWKICGDTICSWGACS